MFSPIRLFALLAILATLAGDSVLAQPEGGEPMSLETARAWVEAQPRTFENQVLFTVKDGQIVRSGRFTTASAIFGDFDGDSDVDLYDYIAMQICLSFSGPGSVAPPACNVFDVEGDQDTDLHDFAAFAAAHTGSTSVVMVEAGNLVPVRASADGYYSGEPGTSGNNALNGNAQQMGYDQDDLWYTWSVQSQMAGSGEIVIGNTSRPRSAFTVLPPLPAGLYVFHLSVVNLVTGESGVDTTILRVNDCLAAEDCDDGDLCTTDTCQGGVCQFTALTCNDELACTSDSCNEVTGTCLHVDLCPSGQICDSNLRTCVSSPECELTLEADDIVGTVGDDVCDAPLIFFTGTGTLIASLQTADRVDARGGMDRLDAELNGGVVAPSLTSIETINIRALTATTLNASNFMGVNAINSVESLGTLTVASMQEHTDIGLSEITDGTSGVSITFATAVTTGSADAITTTLTGANAGTVTVTTGATNGFETLNVAGTGSTANTLTAITQGTGTTMVTANLAGDQATQLKALPSTIRSYDASSMTGTLTLGSGTRADATDTYASFATVDIANMTGGTGNDVFVFGATLDGSDADQEDEWIDGGAGHDILQMTISSSRGGLLPIRNIEELRVNASASSSSFSLLNVSGVSTVTVESDDTANTMTVDNVPVTSTAQTWPTLAFRGDGTQAAQTYDTITFNGFGASASTGDKMTVSFANRGTALNSSGTTNAHTVTSMTVGSSSSTGMETLTITAADGPLSVTSTTTCFSCTGITVTGSSNVGLGTMTGTADSVTSLTATGVTGNFTATIDNMNGGTIQLGTGNDTVDTTGSAASAMVIQGGAGNDTLTGAGGSDNILGGRGTDTLVGAAGADMLSGGDDNDTIQGDGSSDTITTGNGADTVVLTTVAADSANADTISDFTAGSGGDQLDMDISALETSGATDANEAVNFVELQDGSAVVDTDSVVIQELTLDAAAGAVATVANTNVFVVIGTVASTSVLETALEAGGDVELTIAAAGGDITSCFPVVYSNATDAFLAICFAETEGVDDTNFEAADLVCINIAKMSSNAAITASEFVAANFDFVP